MEIKHNEFATLVSENTKLGLFKKHVVRVIADHAMVSEFLFEEPYDGIAINDPRVALQEIIHAISVLDHDTWDNIVFMANMKDAQKKEEEQTKEEHHDEG